MSDRRQPRLIFGLMRAQRAIRRWIDARAADTPISAAGAGVLFHLARDTPSRVTDIAAALDASPAATTGLIHRLETAGIVTKTPDPTDARSTLVDLTDHGRTLLPAAKRILAELNAHVTEGFTVDELATVERWLEQASRLRPGR